MSNKPSSDSPNLPTEKDLLKESKQDEKFLNRALKDLQRVEKEEAKMKKAVGKTASVLQKNEKKEVSTSKALSKAERQHDIALANVKSAEADTRTKKVQEARLQREINEKKAQVEAATQQKNRNDSVRSQIRSERSAHS